MVISEIRLEMGRTAVSRERLVFLVKILRDIASSYVSLCVSTLERILNRMER